jgi:hypothetical protein
MSALLICSLNLSLERPAPTGRKQSCSRHCRFSIGIWRGDVIVPGLLRLLSVPFGL